jgi:predicted ArsR family transcriptional regulator|tara:strand:+ start:983 stop:1366 length:384 start_codon:yes stop_codon:yes gene_type:complete
MSQSHCPTCGQRWLRPQQATLNEFLAEDTVPAGVQGTSREAFTSIQKIRAGDGYKILRKLEREASTGATCDEMETELGLSHQTASARCHDLLRFGAIERSGLRRATRSGRSAHVYVLTTVGWDNVTA